MKTTKENEFTQINQRLDQLVNGITQINLKITDLDRKVTDLDRKVTDLDRKVTDLDRKVTDLDKNQSKIEAKIETWKPILDKIPDLAEKIGELKNWRQIAIIIITVVITSVAWILRMGKL